METLTQIKSHSVRDDIPIVRDLTLKLINNIINKHHVKTILEIGTAYGYSACALSKNPNIKHIVSLEKDQQRFQIAKSYLINDSKIKLILSDAFKYHLNHKYDLIFIDGPKAHQQELVEKYYTHLNKNGIMIIDNIYLKKITSKLNPTKNQKALSNKVKQFHEWLIKQTWLNIKIINIDDGIAICYK